MGWLIVFFLALMRIAGCTKLGEMQPPILGYPFGGLNPGLSGVSLQPDGPPHSSGETIILPLR